MESNDQLIFREEDAEPSSSSSANHKLLTIAQMIDTLAKEKIAAQAKLREQELVEQKRLVAEYATKCEKLQETVKSLEKQLQNPGQETLKYKLQKSDLRCQLLESEYKKLFAKHKKLRARLAYFASTLKESALANAPKTDMPLSHGTLAALSAHVNKKLEKLESSRKYLQGMLRQNSDLVSLLMTKLKVNTQSVSDEEAQTVITPNISKGSKCSACGKVYPSRQKLQEHRRNVHTVQNCKKFLQKKRAAASVQLRLNSTWNIVPSSPDKNGTDFSEDSTLVIPDIREEEQRSHMASTSLEAQDISMNDSNRSSCLHEVDETRENDGYICRCGYKATTRSRLVNHIRYHSTEKKFICEACGIGFISGKKKRRHLLLKHKIRTGGSSLSLLECGRCGMTFKNRSRFMKHHLTAHRTSQLPLQRNAPEPQELEISNQGTFKESAALSPFFENTTSSKGQDVRQTRSKSNTVVRRKSWKLQRNDLAHDVDRSLSTQGFFCTCGRESPNRKALIKHIRHYNPRTMFQCSVCEKSYPSYNKLRNHKRIKHNLECPGVGCGYCGEILTNLKDLRTHQIVSGCTTTKFGSKVTKTVVPMAAPPPPISRKQAAVKGMHEAVSQPEEGKFGCHLCGRTFVLLSLLRQHLKHIHKRVTTWSKGKMGCSLCGQMFDTLKLLYKHRQVSHGNAPSAAYGLTRCKSLQKANSETSTANPKQTPSSQPPPSIRREKPKEHYFVTTKIHQIDRSKRNGFYCRCGSRHVTQRTLQQHIWYFTKERKFGCQFCPKKFPSQCYLRRHIESHHKIQKLRKYGKDAQVEEAESSQRNSASVSISENPTLLLSTPSSPVSSATNDDLRPVYSSVTCPIEYFTTSHTQNCSDIIDQITCKCGMRFRNKDTLNAHVRFYALCKAFLCSCCQEAFSSFRDMNAHIRESHNIEPDPDHLGCPSCGVIFANKHEYRRHMIMTTNDQNKFQSRRCPMMLLNKQTAESTQSLEKLEVVTTNPAPVENPPTSLAVPGVKFAFSMCAKSFLYSNSLRSDMVSAHKIVENPGIGCKDCGEFFPNNMELYNHHRVVHNYGTTFAVGTKYTPSTTAPSSPQLIDIDAIAKSIEVHKPLPVDRNIDNPKYKCCCGKEFSSSSSRRSHIQRKTIGKIFVCFWCPGTSRTRFDLHATLKAHVKLMHPEVANKLPRFSCGLCAKTFYKIEQVRQHRANEHPERSRRKL